MEGAQVLYIDASTPIMENQISGNNKIIPHQIVCLNFSISNCVAGIPYQLRLSIESNKIVQEIGYTAPHTLVPGQTKISFNLSFIVDYYFNKIQNLKIDIAKGPGQYTIITPLSSILTANYATIILPFDKSNPNETITIIGTEMKNSNQMIEININLVNCIQPAFFVISKSKLNQKTNNKEMVAVFKTESSTGQFSPIVLSQSYLDFGDQTKPIGFDLYLNYVKAGTYETTLQELLGNEIVSMNIASHSIFVKAKTFQNTKKSFVNYLQMKLNMNLFIGIDFTGSNGHYKDTASLHHIDPKNPSKLTLYESAILECGTILSYYDSDKIYPVYGFGAILPSKEVSHCFPLTLNPNDDADIQGLNNVLAAYRKTIEKIHFAGPTYFEPLLSLIFTTIASMDNSGLNYNVVLLLTDGIINDMEKTVDLIVESSNLPVSLIIVGVGNADFSNMKRLDSDGKALVSSKGKKSERDIVQFVEFNEVGNNPKKLAEKVLEELPKQVEEYFNKNNK